MKKLMLATALVASAAAFADPINAIGFEGYAAGATFANGDAEQAEGGGDKGAGPYFYFQGEQDASSVKAFGGDNATAPNITRPLAFADASPNANYLDLSTEGGILWRGINNITQSGTQEAPTYSLGGSTNIVAGGLYFDALVQFTPTEDGKGPEDDLTNDDKLAIWLNVDTTTTPATTNLMVRAAIIDDQTNLTPTNFVINNATVAAGEWHRLTVKALADATDGDDVPAFMIYLDGTLLTSSLLSFTGTYIEQDAIQDSEYKSEIEGGSVFVSLKADGAATLTAVGFKGSGALDDIVWTEENPLAGGSSGSDYVVEIAGSDVVIQPQAGDLEALQAAIVAGGGTLDVTDVDAVNAALAAEIGSTGIPAWQALFLGLAPTEAGLASFKIDSISFNSSGEVEVTLPTSVTPMTGRGVDITVTLMAAATPNAAAEDWDEAATGTISGGHVVFGSVDPNGATKEFYKVVVEFAASQD